MRKPEDVFHGEQLEAYRSLFEDPANPPMEIPRWYFKIMSVTESMFVSFLDHWRKDHWKEAHRPVEKEQWFFCSPYFVNEHLHIERQKQWRLLDSLQKKGVLSHRTVRGHRQIRVNEKFMENCFRLLPEITKLQFVEFVSEDEQDKDKEVTPQVVKRKKTKIPKSLLPGFVYLFSAANGLFKIGYSKNPDKRLSGINGESPIQVVLVHKIATNDMMWLEKKLHRKYANKRAHGEWFRLSKANVKAISSITVCSRYYR